MKVPPPVTVPIGSESTPGAILYAWVQLAPGGTLLPGGTVELARAVLAGEGQPCPTLQLDDLALVAMTARPNPAPGDGSFPITVCEQPLVRPDRQPAARAQLADRILPIPGQASGQASARLAVIGGTACRTDGPCSEADWTFERTARTIARRQAPTLVVHLGDYRFRKNDTWQGWETDFFKPASELLQVAPWLTVRGNHESCSSNGRGWFYLLDPSSTTLGTAPLRCPGPRAATYSVAVPLTSGGSQRLTVADSAEAPTGELDLAAAGSGAWLLTHCPADGIAAHGIAPDGGLTLKGYGFPPGFLLLTWNGGAKSWSAAHSSPRGDETRPCRISDGALDCGFPVSDPPVPDPCAD